MKLHCTPQIIIGVVYKIDDGWRGFCFPFDVTCEATTKEETIKKLDQSIKVYIDGLEKYNFPENLSLKKLSDPADIKVFEQVVDKIMNEYAKRFFVITKEKKLEYKEKGIFSYLSQPCLAN